MRPPALQPNAALSEILARDLENGIDVFDNGHRPARPAPGPPVTIAPLIPVAIPAPDWREEEERARRRDEEERARRVPAEDPAPPPPQSLTARPAKRQKKPAATPNLDEAMRWIEELRR